MSADLHLPKQGSVIPLSPEAQRALLTIARAAIAHRLNLASPLEVVDPREELQQSCGVFVTLLLEGRLRGCIGSLESNRPVMAVVEEMAEAAAFQDPRFPAVTPDEFPYITIEISLLSPIENVESPEDIEIGKHGVLVRLGGRQGLLLPQVAMQNNWDLPTLLTHACLKAGLPGDTWREPDLGLEIYRFTAQVFGEEDDDEQGG